MRTLDIFVSLENKAYPYTSPANNNWTVITVGNNNYGVRLIPNSKTLVIRGQYPQMYFESLTQDWETLSKKIPSMFTNERLVNRIKSKMLEVKYHFINIKDYWFKPNKPVESVSRFINFDDSITYRKIKFDQNIETKEEYNSFNNTTKEFSREILEGEDLLLHNLKLIDMGQATLKQLEDDMKQNPHKYDITSYKNEHTKDVLKQCAAIIIKHTPRKQYEAPVYYDNKTGESNMIYYKTYTLINYHDITINCNSNIQYLLPKKIRENKYLKINFSDKIDCRQNYSVYKKQYINGAPAIDENGDEIYDFVGHIDHDQIKTSIIGVKDVCCFGGRQKISGKYHLVKFSDSKESDNLTEVVASPNATINEYSVWSGIPDIHIEHMIIEPNSHDWLNQFIGSNYRDKYSKEEILAIIKYSIQGEDTILELKHSASNGMFKITNDLNHLKSLGYTGEIWYRIIHDERMVYDLEDASLNGDDPEDDSEDSAPVLYKNEWLELCTTYNNYVIIDGKIYLIFKL